MSQSKPSVGIFGATGHLGTYIAQAFVDKDRRSLYSDVILFTRSTSKLSPELQAWRDDGSATIVEVAQDASELHSQLADMDIVVNTISGEGNALRTKIVQALEDTNVKLYLPSEFGVDHTVHDFNHPEWDKKKAHFELASKVLKNTKICRIYCGFFLEDSIGPWFGFDTKNDRYESYGSADELVAYTSLGDVGKIVANLVLLPPDDIPSQLHFCGNAVSMNEIADIMRSKSGHEIKTTELPLEESKAKELKATRPDPSGCLRFLMGEGRIKHTPDAMGCDNELVNPKQSKWKWKTMADLASETSGLPWADAAWS